MLSLKAGGTGLNLTAANHVVLYDRWWNPAVEDQARDRAWRIGQSRTVISHRLVCPGTIDERVEEVVAGKRHIAQLVLPRSSSIADLNTDQLRLALGLRPTSCSPKTTDEPARPARRNRGRRRPPPKRHRRRRHLAHPGAAARRRADHRPRRTRPRLLRSLGDPPMPDRANAADHFTTVVERAAAVAAALALSADLLDHAD